MNNENFFCNRLLTADCNERSSSTRKEVQRFQIGTGRVEFLGSVRVQLSISGANAHRGVELNCQIQQITGFVTFNAKTYAMRRSMSKIYIGNQHRWKFIRKMAMTESYLRAILTMSVLSEYFQSKNNKHWLIITSIDFRIILKNNFNRLWNFVVLNLMYINTETLMTS